MIAFLREENRILKARLEDQRLRLNDSERRLLGEVGHRLGRPLLASLVTIVTPDTILRWHLILDDWGLVAVTDVQRQDLLEVMEDCDAARCDGSRSSMPRMHDPIA